MRLISYNALDKMLAIVDARHAASVRRQIITWYTPQEKLPERGRRVLITLSSGPIIMKIGEYWPEEKKWVIEGMSLYAAEHATVYAWADVEPYWGEN